MAGMPRLRGMDALRYRYGPTRVILRRGLREGVLGGKRGWLAAFITLEGFIILKRAVTRQSEHVAIDVLKPGERILVRAIPVSSPKERKRLLRGG